MARKKMHEEFVNDIKNIYGDDFSVETKYNGNRENVDLKCSKCGHIKNTSPNNALTNKLYCLNCAGKVINTEIVENMIKANWGDEYTLIKPYTKDKDGIWVRHNSENCNENEFRTYVSNFIYKKQGCKVCSDISNGKNKTDKAVRRLVEYVDYVDGYTFLEEPKRAKDKFLIKPEFCGHEPYMATRQDFERGSRCPKCRRSKGEELIEKLLIENNVSYKTQYTFSDLYYKNKLRFDFAIFDNVGDVKCIIEFDGVQHYKPVDFFGGIENFEKIKKRDSIKNKYCLDNNIEMIRISYLEFDSIEYIINEKIIKKVKL